MKKITFLILILLMDIYTFNSQTLQWDWVKNGQTNAVSSSNKSVTDSNGNIYICGSFSGASITIGSYALTNTSSGSFQMFIAKYNPSGLLLWARTYIHNDYSNIRSATIDPNDNLLITGDFSQSVTFDTITITNSNLSSTTMYIAKISPEGAVIWAKGAGNTSTTVISSWAQDITTDANGNVYISGHFYYSNLIIDATTTLTMNGSNNFFLIKYDQNGNVQLAKKGIMFISGGGLWSRSMWVTVDNIGNIYLTGSFTGSMLFDTMSVSTTASSTSFVAKYNSAGQIQYVKKYGTIGSNNANEIETDSNNNVYLLGDYSNAVTFGSTVLTNSGIAYSDVFLLKLNTVGDILWAKKSGGTYNDLGNNLAITSNNIYVSGEFNSPTLTIDSITLTNGIPTSPINTESGFISKYDLDGNLIAATSALNTGRNSMNSVSAHNDFIYTSGYYINNFTLGDTTLSSPGYNFFIAKLNSQTLGIVNHYKNSITVFPNPVKDILNINTTENNFREYKIINLLGNVILQGKAINEINIADIQSGIYVLSVEGENIKFIKD